MRKMRSIGSMILFESREKQDQIHVALTEAGARRLLQSTTRQNRVVATYTTLLNEPQANQISATMETDSAKIQTYLMDEFQSTSYDVRVEPENIAAMTSQIELSAQQILAGHNSFMSSTAAPASTASSTLSAETTSSATGQSAFSPSQPAISSRSLSILLVTLMITAALLFLSLCASYMFIDLRSRSCPSNKVSKFDGVVP